MTPVYKIESNINNVYIKREDMIPYSFGGNKARKALLFFDEIEKLGCNYVVTYGSGSSNHCRVIANMACERGIPCILISPEETLVKTKNYVMCEMFDAKHVICPVTEVSQTIDNTMKQLYAQGYKPYFIEGGGHGNIGTEAYVNCYREILNWEQEHKMKFDYIFLASGTGTTQAGLVCGAIINSDLDRRIVGISIARNVERGRMIIYESICKYLETQNLIKTEDVLQNMLIFEDEYISKGYGGSEDNINKAINDMMKYKGIPLDSTYTGKAYWGMNEYIKKNDIIEKNILFIHTGGTPLFFDWLDKRKEYIYEN